jgi:hypothetical protein
LFLEKRCQLLTFPYKSRGIRGYDWSKQFFRRGKMSKSYRLVAVGLAAVFALSSAGVAQAYPAGTNPALGLSSYSRVAPGDSVTVSVTRILKDCNVDVAWSGNGGSFHAVAGKTRRTAPQSVQSPSIGGQYTLSAALGTGCGIDSGKTISKAITVGRLVRHSVSIKTSSSSARRNPTLTLAGKIFWGSEAQAGLPVTLVLTPPVGDAITLTARTDANGAYSTSFGANGAVQGTVVQGQYTVVTTLAADSTYAGSRATSRTVTIRR